jgi:molecular chaperone Hsp33
MEKDQILRALVADKKAIIWIARTTETVKQAQNVHKLSNLAASALGRALTGAGLMATGLKKETDEITLQIKGDGPIGNITVVADQKGSVRGYVANADVDLPLLENGKPDVAGAVGKGYLTVIKDVGMKEPYIGQVQLQSGEIAQDLAYYYAASEQTPSVVYLSVRLGQENQTLSAGGRILQPMPDCDDVTLRQLENRATDILQIGSLLEEGLALSDIVHIVFVGMQVDVLEEKPIQFACPCSYERMYKALLTLGEKELSDIIKEQGEAELVCHFCGNKYLFAQDDLQKMIVEIHNRRTSS